MSTATLNVATPFFSWNYVILLRFVFVVYRSVSPAPLHKPEEGKIIEAPTFGDEGFLTESCRALYSDVMYDLKPPIPSLLDNDLSLLPPAEETGKAGRPNKSPRKRARFRSNEEFKSVSTIGRGGDTTISSPERSSKQPIPGIGLHGWSPT